MRLVRRCAGVILSLSAKKLVRREPDPTDRRGVIVVLTAKGLRVIDAAIQLRLEAADKGIQGLNKKERATLASLLRKVVLGAEPDTTERR